VKQQRVQAGALGGRGPLFNLLSLPLVVRDLVFLGHVYDKAPLAGVGGAGAFAVAGYVAVVAVSVGVLLWRYRWAER